MTATGQVDRRSFLATAAAASGAFVLGFEFAVSDIAQAAEDGPEINAWVIIHPDDSIILRYPRAEMGQGSYTAVPMMLAEELECDWSKVKVEIVEPAVNLKLNRIYGDMFSYGSRSVRDSQDYVRKAGAAAREMLITAAAEEWKVPAPFGTIAAVAAKLDVPKDIKLKDPKDGKIAGKPAKRLDVSNKVQGKPIYGIDVRLPKMMYASLVQCPVFKGTLKSVDDSKLGGMPGVRKVVKFPNAVAVVAGSWWRAKRAAEALKISWDDGGNGNASTESITEFVRAGLSAPDAGVGRKQGDVAAGLAQAAKRIEAEYQTPFLAHATMEPQNCTAHVVGDKAEIWASTQDAERSMKFAAHALGIALNNIILHPTLVGGGFGRRGAPQDFITYAALLPRRSKHR